jgi:hypothetical protein
MASRKPFVNINGTQNELPATDTLSATLTLNIVSITTDTTIANDGTDKLFVISGSGTINLTLPTAISFNNQHKIIILSAFAGTFNLVTVLGQTIHGDVSPQQFYPDETFILLSDNSNLLII